jgi:hypothetical protein
MDRRVDEDAIVAPLTTEHLSRHLIERAKGVPGLLLSSGGC